MKTPQAAVKSYLQGYLVLVDLLIRLGGCLAEDEAAMFVASLPKDLLDEVLHRVNDLPHTEEGWSQLRVFAISSRIGPVSSEQLEREQREDVRLLRRGVELIRAGLADRSAAGEP
jgi:hypothetical protein